MRQLGLLVALLGGGFASSAHAYGFMMRHDYVNCGACHVDPSGGSVLTPYGRAQAEVLLRSRYGKPVEEEPGKEAAFLFGLFNTPEELMLGGDVRLALMSPGFRSVRVFPMQADLVAAVRSGKLSASVSLGVGTQASQQAKVFGDQIQLVSRHHWVGYSPDEDQAFLLRAGRMALPFGVRLPEHTSWVRSVTGTDTNTAQQHGVSLSYSGEKVRGELMGILGNMQLSPAAFRQRGYSGFLEFAPLPVWTVGVSSQLTHADADFTFPDLAVFRNAHGLFSRLAAWKPLVVSLEVDVTHVSRRRLGGDFGLVGLLQLDLEPTQGLHVVALGEVLASSFTGPASAVPGLGVWGGLWWFFAPHADVRVDVITRREADGALNVSLLAQLHAFL